MNVRRTDDWVWVIAPLVLVLLTLVPSAKCDQIPLNDWLPTNGAGGGVSFVGGELSGSGGAYNGGTFSFTNSGHSGEMFVSGPDFTLQGSLSKTFFNPKTGLLQGYFYGTLQEDGQFRQIYHANFQESVNLKTGQLNWGWVRYGTAPEPGTWLTGLTGLLGIGAAWWRRVRT
jgi:hypothetical protein